MAYDISKTDLNVPSDIHNKINSLDLECIRQSDVQHFEKNRLFTIVNGKLQINEEYSKSKRKGYVTLDEFNQFIDSFDI